MISTLRKISEADTRRMSFKFRISSGVGGGGLRYISDGEIWRPFLGLKLATWNFFGVELFWTERFWQDFYNGWQKGAYLMVLNFMLNSCISFLLQTKLNNMQIIRRLPVFGPATDFSGWLMRGHVTLWAAILLWVQF